MSIASFSMADTILTAATTIDRVRLYACRYASGATDAQISAVVVADEDTRGFNVVQLQPTGAGANSGWTGTYADVEETGFNDADYIESLTAGQTSTFAFEDLPAGVLGHNVKAVAISGRGRVGATSPTEMKTVARVSGTDYEAAPVMPMTTSYGPFQSVYQVNPATGLAWAQSAVNGAEFGVRSAT